jgi:hypothetical protein
VAGVIHEQERDKGGFCDKGVEEFYHCSRKVTDEELPMPMASTNVLFLAAVESSSMCDERKVMFGFGYLELIIVVLLLVLVLGAGPARKLFETLFGVYRQVEETKQEIRKTFSLGDWFTRKKK